MVDFLTQTNYAEHIIDPLHQNGSTAQLRQRTKLYSTTLENSRQYHNSSAHSLLEINIGTNV